MSEVAQRREEPPPPDLGPLTSKAELDLELGQVGHAYLLVEGPEPTSEVTSQLTRLVVILAVLLVPISFTVVLLLTGDWLKAVVVALFFALTAVVVHDVRCGNLPRSRLDVAERFRPGDHGGFTGRSRPTGGGPVLR